VSKSRKILVAARLISVVCASLLLLLTLAAGVSSQRKSKAETANQTPALPALVRTATRNQVRRLGYGGTITIFGAPEGSITIEAWPQGTADISADIELRANTEEELAQLAAVNGFLLDTDGNRLRILTTGTHDRKYMKRVAKDFPKKLLTMPWKIDYRLRVPALTDLEIYAGRGALSLSGVEGALRLNAGESNASLLLTGGDVEATVERGSVDVRIAARSWRGRGASIRLGHGDLTVELPANFNGDINAEVLRSGRIENGYAGLAPREENTQPNERLLRARAGAGGATLSFTVADGTIRIKQESSKE